YRSGGYAHGAGARNFGGHECTAGRNAVRCFQDVDTCCGLISTSTSRLYCWTGLTFTTPSTTSWSNGSPTYSQNWDSVTTSASSFFALTENHFAPGPI